MQSITRFLFAAAVAAAIFATAAQVFAQKKEDGALSGGGDYYSYYDASRCDYATMQINRDGSSPTQVIAGPSVDEPSHAVHGGKRRFIDAGDHDIHIVSETGESVSIVDEPDLPLVDAPHWQRVLVDRGVSFEVELWGTNSESGVTELLNERIFFVLLEDRVSGAPIGAVPNSLTGHDWGGDGRLVFSLRDVGVNSGLWIAELTEPEELRRTWVSTGADRGISVPAGSPDESRIAFKENSSGIGILTLANSRRKTIPNSATHGAGTVWWAPAGDGLFCHRVQVWRLTIRTLPPGTGRKRQDGSDVEVCRRLFRLAGLRNPCACREWALERSCLRGEWSVPLGYACIHRSDRFVLEHFT